MDTESKNKVLYIQQQAKASVQVIDNYIGLKTLELLRSVPTGIPITVFSDNVGVKDKLTKIMYNDFIKEYPSVKINLISIGNRFHDRYIILDHGTATEKIYHCGASSKDAGQRFTSINVMRLSLLTDVWNASFDGKSVHAFKVGKITVILRVVIWYNRMRKKFCILFCWMTNLSCLN